MTGATWPEAAVDPASMIRRLESLAVDGIRSDADLTWFIGPNGFLRCCQLQAAGVAIDLSDDDLDALLDEIDDHLTVAGTTTASDRARALRAVARAASPAAEEAAGLLLARSVIGAETQPTLDAVVELVVADARRLLRPTEIEGVSILSDGIEPRLAVPIAVSTHARGEIVRLELRPGPGRAGVAPDIEEAPFQRYDPDFIGAVVDAHQAALGGRGGWRFSIHSTRTGLPLDAVTGRSVGLGAAIGLSLLDAGRRSPIGLDPRWVFTGDVRSDGAIGSLLERSNTTAYRNKIAAARHMTLLLPSTDVPDVASLVGEVDCALVGVNSLPHALDLIERHHRGSTAYRRQMEAAPRPFPRWAALALVLLLLGIVGAASLSLWSDDDQAAGATATIRRENPPLRIVPFASATFPSGTTLLFSRTEVTNAAYQVCVTHLVCRQPEGRQARPMGDPGNDRYPVTGVMASDAEVFCEWAYGEAWGLPTFDQFRAAVAQNYRQFPFGDLGNPALVDPPQGLPQGHLAPVDDPAVNSVELAWLTGNVSEWTRTQCSADGVCGDVESSVGSVLQGLRVFGISYLDSDRNIPADWLNSVAFGEDIRLADQGADWVGFRCASQE